jgi:hypothetical protein
MKPSTHHWKTVLTRWSDMSECGERRLMIQLLANAIAEEIEKWHSPEWSGGRDQYFSDGRFDYHATLIGINPQFVRERMEQFAPELV